MIQIGDKVCTDEQAETIRFAIEVLNTHTQDDGFPKKETCIRCIRELREMFDDDRKR